MDRVYQAAWSVKFHTIKRKEKLSANKPSLSFEKRGLGFLFSESSLNKERTTVQGVMRKEYTAPCRGVKTMGEERRWRKAFLSMYE